MAKVADQGGDEHHESLSDVDVPVENLDQDRQNQEISEQRDDVDRLEPQEVPHQPTLDREHVTPIDREGNR